MGGLALRHEVIPGRRAEGAVPAGPAGGPPVPVLFIAGFGRSGSTLLDRLLGSGRQLHSGGEIGGVWALGLVDDRLCSCGARFSRCAFWQAVGRASFGDLSDAQIREVVRYLRRAFPVKGAWRLLSRRTRRRLIESAPPAFFEVTARMYRGLLDVSGRRVVVDSSKLVTYLVLLAHVPSLDLRVVHLVRDPRAVAHSWLRPGAADPDGRSSMPRIGILTSAALWLILNGAVEWAARCLSLPYVRVRYEDLVRDPAAVVRQLRSQVLADPDREDPAPRDRAAADLGAGHIVSGNPMRFRRGRVEIAEDAGWKADPAAARAIVAAVTFPLRWRYGYGGVRLAGPGRRRGIAGRGQPGAADPESAAGGA